MDCPQCGDSLTTYALQSREALVCEGCGYVGIEADHHGTPREVESWNDALRRFYETHTGERIEDPTVPVAAAFGNRTPESTPDPRPVDGGTPAIRRVAGDSERPVPRSVEGSVPAIRRRDADEAVAPEGSSGGTESGGVAEGESSDGDPVQSSAGDS